MVPPTLLSKNNFNSIRSVCQYFYYGTEAVSCHIFVKNLAKYAFDEKPQ